MEKSYCRQLHGEWKERNKINCFTKGTQKENYSLDFPMGTLSK